MTGAGPSQSYIIWFSQRVGSTMLSQALEDTGVAGRPQEWFNNVGESGPEILASYSARDAFELREALWREGTTDNGVFAVKYGMTAELHDRLTALFGGLIPGEVDPDGRKAWAALFPNCRHVFMTRRNKLRLAVSWWRAIKAQEWHRPTRSDTAVGAPPPRSSAAAVADKYDRAALEALLIGANVREAEMQERFDRWGVVPYTVVYEDLIASYEATVRGLLRFLDLPGGAPAAIPAPAFERLADEVSEDWYLRWLPHLKAR
jgi:trehalose 2-sulfotransferase